MDWSKKPWFWSCKLPRVEPELGDVTDGLVAVGNEGRLIPVCDKEGETADSGEKGGDPC